VSVEIGANALVTARPAEFAELPDDPLAFTIEAFRRGWTDGLPVIPPTPERVDAMLAGASRDRMEVVGVMAPRSGVASVEVVAVNAVMAGCEPRHFEVLLAAVEAVCHKDFNVAAINATTHPVAMLILVSDPAARAAGVHAGSGVFGPGFRANMCIGRALRLVQFSVAGARPGAGDMATMGSPAKIAFCAAERADATPWPAYHTTKGLDADDFAVTVFPAEAPGNIQDHASTTAEGIMATIAGAMGHAGHNNIVGPHKGHPVLAVGVEHAQTIAASGWSREDVQAYIAQHACYPRDRLGAEFLASIKPLRKELAERLPIAHRPEQVQVFVTGGPGKHSMFMPTFAGSYEATVSWTPKAGRR
jgi:hypothetical protein